ncbi:hypothetical protein BLNAU_18449 [Blattamonas nauphoetae]|uniref:Right handed beta helix domain-containing protein n=1 Tax=Blattamonas nauphoetae TaxID=2049346 RepID=A0ABQ9X4B5_9EUKA|nr:hypothetical protein BLNAU_18449 [Blattamonas nauphoetae]
MQLTLLLCLSILSTDLQPHPLVDLLEKHCSRSSSGDAESPQQIAIPRGHFHISEYPIQSLNLVMTGMDTTITYQDIHKQGNEKNCVSLTNINLDSTSGGSRVGTVSSSILTLRCCEIFSNIECSPFAIGDGWGTDGSSILVVGSSHRCPTSSSLLPLVSLLPVRERQTNQPGVSYSADTVSITSVGLSIANSHLLVGTGPLLDFGSLRNEEAEQIALSTTLSSCVLSNTTSSPSQSASGIPSGTCQTIVGCGISNSTNHLYGTACNDMNLGGSLLTRNTSFVLCNAGYNYKVYSTRSLIEANSDFEYCTFKKCSSGEFGGALFMYYDSNVVSIENCAFDSCLATQGGAIYCLASGSYTDFRLYTSSFVHCRAEIAGSVGLLDLAPNLWQVFFYDSTSQYSAGALRLTDCAFLNSFYDLLFDSCRHVSVDSSLRVGFDIAIHQPNLEWKGIDHTSEMPNPAHTAKVLSLTSTESGYSGQLTLTLDKPASGTFFVVLDNAYGTPRTDPDYYPNIGRLVMFPFSGTESSTLSVGTDNWDVLQSPLHEYMLHAVSMNEWEVVQPTFTTVEVNRDESGTMFDFTLKGKDIPNGTYTIILDDKHELDVVVTTDLTGESEGFG